MVFIRVKYFNLTFSYLIQITQQPIKILDDGPIAELPENWDQTKDDNQSLFLNKSDKNDLEPYPLALSEEGKNNKNNNRTEIKSNYSEKKTKIILNIDK